MVVAAIVVIVVVVIAIVAALSGCSHSSDRCIGSGGNGHGISGTAVVVAMLYCMGSKNAGEFLCTHECPVANHSNPNPPK